MALLHQRLTPKKNTNHQYHRRGSSDTNTNNSTNTNTNTNNSTTSTNRRRRSRRFFTRRRSVIQIVVFLLAALLAFWWLFYFSRLRRLHQQQDIDHDHDHDLDPNHSHNTQQGQGQQGGQHDLNVVNQSRRDLNTNINSINSNSKGGHDQNENANANVNANANANVNTKTQTQTTTSTSTSSPTTKSKLARPLTHQGEVEIQKAIHKSFTQHMILQNRASWWRGLGWFGRLFQPNPEAVTNLTFVEQKQLNQTIMDIFVKHRTRRRIVPDADGELRISMLLSEQEKFDIQEDIDRVSSQGYHTQQGEFDSCRGIFWNQILIRIPGVCSDSTSVSTSVSATTSTTTSDREPESDTDTDQSRHPVQVQVQDQVQSQMDKVIHHVAPYVPKMKAEGRTHRTVLIVPNAICLGTNSNSNINSNSNSNIKSDSDSNINKYDITLTTHMGAGKYQRFLVLLQRWNGPISIAVKFTTLDEIQSFHTFVLDHLLPYFSNKEGNEHQHQHQHQHQHPVSFHYYMEHAPEYANAYPQNILRNIAMTYISTEYFLVNDVDIFPSPMDTHDKLRAAIASQPDIQHGLSTDTVYVIPMFDFHEMVPESELTYDYSSFPNSKEDVIRMNATGLISQHLLKQYPQGHRAVNYERWFGNDTEASYGIAHEHRFEPYVIGSRNMRKEVPLFYPYFRGFGFDKYSWYDELAWSGIKLRVMRDFYLFHAKHESSYPNRQELLDVNRECAQGFMRDVLGRYGLQEGDPLWNEWLKEIYL